MGAVVAVVPLKALSQAKGRLADDLDPWRRRALVAAMLEVVLDACRASPAVNRTLVVAGDSDGEQLARRLGVEALREPTPGLNPALAAADAAVVALDPTATTLIVAADLPLCTAGDLDAVVGTAESGPVVVVAPTQDGGTGALLRRPTTVIGTAYGPGSAQTHLRLAHRAGVPGRRVERRGLAVDVDTLTQLERAIRLGAPLGS